jgi:hypothetical protein
MRSGYRDTNRLSSVCTTEEYWVAAKSLNDHYFVIIFREMSRRSAQLNPYKHPEIFVSVCGTVLSAKREVGHSPSLGRRLFIRNYFFYINCMYIFLTVNILVNIQAKFSDTSHGNCSPRQAVPSRDKINWCQMWNKPQQRDKYPVHE